MRSSKAIHLRPVLNAVCVFYFCLFLIFLQYFLRTGIFHTRARVGYLLRWGWFQFLFPVFSFSLIISFWFINFDLLVCFVVYSGLELKCCVRRCTAKFANRVDLARHYKSAHSIHLCSFLQCSAGMKKANMKDHYRHVHAGYRYVCLGCDAQFNWRNTVNTHINSTACKGSSYEERYIPALDHTKPKSDVSKPVPRAPKRTSTESSADMVANKSLKMTLQPSGMDFASALSVLSEGSARFLTKEAVVSMKSTVAVIGEPTVSVVGNSLIDSPSRNTTSAKTTTGLAPLHKVAGLQKPVGLTSILPRPSKPKVLSVPVGNRPVFVLDDRLVVPPRQSTLVTQTQTEPLNLVVRRQTPVTTASTRLIWRPYEVAVVADVGPSVPVASPVDTAPAVVTAAHVVAGNDTMSIPTVVTAEEPVEAVPDVTDAVAAADPIGTSSFSGEQSQSMSVPFDAHSQVLNESDGAMVVVLPETQVESPPSGGHDEQPDYSVIMAFDVLAEGLQQADLVEREKVMRGLSAREDFLITELMKCHRLRAAAGLPVRYNFEDLGPEDLEPDVSEDKSGLSSSEETGTGWSIGCNL